jgi:hypothetical protein
MNRARITDVFAQPPASFQFQEAKPTADGPRLLGAAPGGALQLDGPPEAITKAVLSVTVPSDDLNQARWSGNVIMLLLVAFAPKWHAWHQWAMACLRQGGAGALVQTFTSRHLGWRYTLRTDRARALVTLTIAHGG